MNLSFAGCGFLGIYHVGVAVCFKKYAPHILLDKIAGASFGAISACCLLCDLPLGEITSDVLRVVNEARSGSLGPFSPSFNVQNVLLEGLQKFLPADAHKIVSGKLHISLTRVYDGKNVIVSEFASKEDLLQALLASCFVPVFSGMLPPRFHGIRYMDGGFSDNLPILDENTITVSPFCGESDICPRDLSSQLFHVNLANTSIELSKQNMNRFARILFPPKPEVLSNMCKQGFDDALRFLHRNNLISCTRCLSVQSTFQLQEALDETSDYDPECEECKTHRQDALVADLPETVMTVFQNAIDSANKGIINWIFKHRGMKLLSVMTIPYRLPADMVYATFTKIKYNAGVFSLLGESFEQHTLKYKVLGSAVTYKNGCDRHTGMYTRFMSCTPRMSKSLWRLSMGLLQQLHGFLYSVNDKSDLAKQMYYKLSMESFESPAHKWEAIDAHHASDRRRGSITRRASLLRLALTGSAVVPATQTHEDDTFDHILNVTAQNDALLAFYYMDENNKMKVTEIFDVTDSELDSVKSPAERDANKRLEFDNEWGGDINLCDELDAIADMQLDDDLQGKNIFSDPESEWGRPHSPPSITEIEDDLTQPESDQTQRYLIRSEEYRIAH